MATPEEVELELVAAAPRLLPVCTLESSGLCLNDGQRSVVHPGCAAPLPVPDDAIEVSVDEARVSWYGTDAQSETVTYVCESGSWQAVFSSGAK